MEHKAMVAQLRTMRAQKPTGRASFYFCFFSLGHCKDIWSSNALSAINSYCNFVWDRLNKSNFLHDIQLLLHSAHLETVNYSTCVSLKKNTKKDVFIAVHRVTTS